MNCGLPSSLLSDVFILKSLMSGLRSMISRFSQTNANCPVAVEVERAKPVGEYFSQQMVHESGNIELFCVFPSPERFTEFGRSERV